MEPETPNKQFKKSLAHDLVALHAEKILTLKLMSRGNVWIVGCIRVLIFALIVLNTVSVAITILFLSIVQEDFATAAMQPIGRRKDSVVSTKVSVLS